MKKIHSLPAPTLVKPKFYTATLAYAFLITVVTVSLLFDLDTIVDAKAFSSQTGLLFITIMIAVSVFSLPYVLRLGLSPLFRFMSFVFSCLVPLYWLTYVVSLSGSLDKLGMFGTHFASSANAYAVVAAGFIGAIASVVALGVPRLK